MADRKTNAPVNRKHLARQEREDIQKRYILIGTIVTVVAVVILLIAGYIYSGVYLPNQTVASVNGEIISLGKYQANVRFERNFLVNNYIQTYQTMQLFAGQSEIELQFANQMQQIQFQLEPATVGRTVLNSLIDNEVVAQWAEELGITVSDDEINTYIQEQFGFFAGGATPTATSFPTLIPTSTLSPLQLTLVPPTATATATLEPTATLEAEATVEAPTATLEPTATPTVQADATATQIPTITPTPTVYTEDLFDRNFRDYLNNLSTGLNYSEENFREYIRSILLRTKVFEAITSDLPTTEEQIWMRHIQVADQQTADQVLTALQEGSDWNQLVLEFSQDTATLPINGDLGWQGVDRPSLYGDDFLQAALALEIGQYSQPVQSTVGFHIIQVLGREERSLSEAEYQQLRQETFQNELDRRKADSVIETFDIWSTNTPEEPAIPVELLLN